MSHGRPSQGLRLVLPATSANLGPGFDAVGVALSLTLTVEATLAQHDDVRAEGRDAALCGNVRHNLILDTYRSTCAAAGASAHALALEVTNEIPLGMGCGSSAAARLAGVLLANHFGNLGWDEEQVVAEASRCEGHPDNVAACWHGGFTVSVPHAAGVAAAHFSCDGAWQLMLALPGAGLATEKARAVLPESITRADAVFNVQRVALLTAAFAQERLDLLEIAMHDRLHQPFRKEVCPLLGHLDDLQATGAFAGVVLSGAGPSLLAVLKEQTTLHKAQAKLEAVLGGGVQILPVRVGGRTSVEPF